METRPKKLSSEQNQAVAVELAKMLVKNGHIEEREIAAAAADIAQHASLHEDGYDLAKKLDRYCGWDCNLMMAADLDAYSGMAREAMKKAQKDWVDRNNIQPPYPIGVMITTKRGETGAITGIYEHGPAEYLVKIDGDEEADGASERRQVIAFEDVQPISTAA